MQRGIMNLLFRNPVFRGLILPVALLFFLFACSSSKSPPPKRPVPVTVAAAIQKTIPIQIEAIGAVEPYQTISVKTQITGQITQVYFKEGQDVKKGDPLFKLDCRTYEETLKQAEANLIRDKAHLQHAQQESSRYAFLVEKGYVAKQQYDQVKTNLAALEATVNADKSLVESNRVQLQYCSVHSPIDGRTGSLKVNRGNIVKLNDVEVVVINQIQPIYVTFTVPEKELARIKTYQARRQLPAEALIPGDGRPEKGELTFVDNAVNRATGMITLKGTFANREKRLWPGQFVNVVLTLDMEPNIVMVPSQAVEKGQTGQYVFVVKSDHTVDMRPVTTGAVIRGETAILKGVQTGEKLVTDGHLRLVPGAKVSIKESP
ncbi:MAG TPA: efflux RND transporter periplasmic adaptor subunit [Syntrophus sp. (in: bacteria)]|nr:efflux RND transporter periplasmic adaptor subunit [Syntrophus sp. (in: bacteria)]